MSEVYTDIFQKLHLFKSKILHLDIFSEITFDIAFA